MSDLEISRRLLERGIGDAVGFAFAAIMLTAVSSLSRSQPSFTKLFILRFMMLSVTRLYREANTKVARPLARLLFENKLILTVTAEKVTRLVVQDQSVLVSTIGQPWLLRLDTLSL